MRYRDLLAVDSSSYRRLSSPEVSTDMLSSFHSAQESDSAASATAPETASGLPVWSTTLTQPNRYISAHGIRGFIGGYSEDGLEFWSFPLQLVSGYHLSFLLPKAPSTPAITMLTSIEVDPLAVTRIYTAPDFRVRESIATHANDPGVLVRFTVEGRSDLHIQVHFQPSLNLMWPAGIGGQEDCTPATQSAYASFFAGLSAIHGKIPIFNHSLDHRPDWKIRCAFATCCQ